MFYCSDRLLQLTVSLPQHQQQIHFAQMQFEGLKLSHLQQLLVYSDWELIKEKRNQYGYIQSKMYRFFFITNCSSMSLVVIFTIILHAVEFRFLNHLQKSKLVWIIRFENWGRGVKLQCLTGEEKLGLVWIIRNFGKTEGLRNWEQKSFF